MAFTPLESSDEPKSSGGFVPLEKSATPPVESTGGAAFGVYPKPGMQPSKEGDTTALGVLATRYPEAAAAARGGLATARLAAAVTPPVLPVVGPFAKPIATVAGGLVGAYATSMGINSLEEEVDKLFGTNIIGLKRQQEKERPGLVLATEVAGGAINPWMRPGLPKTIAEGAIGAGLQLGIGGASRAAAGEDVLDPKSTAIDVLTGAFTKPTQRGYRALGVESPTATTKKTTIGDIEKPPEGATPEEKATYLKKIETIKAERDSKAPLVEAAIRNKSTGEIERMGPKHDQARKEATKDTHEEGFVDERGNFHERQVAVDQAKRAGQIPEDYTLENPPGERPGLHSGDLRKVGDERFAIKEEQSVDVPKNNVIKLKTSSKPLSDAEINRALETKEGRRWLAENTDFVSPELAAVFKDPTNFIARRTNELMVEKQNKLYDLYDKYGQSEKNILKSKDAKEFTKLKEEYQTLKDSVDATPKEPKATRANFKEAIDVNEAKRMGLEAQAEEAAKVGDEARVTSINEQIKVLEQEHAQLTKDMPSQETLAYERSDVQEYADRHSTTTESTKEAFVDWLHKSELPLDPAKIGEYEKQFMADVETPKEKILKEKPSTKGVFSEKQIKDAGGSILPLKVAAKRGDGGMSPWLMADGKIVNTGQDHIAFADQFVEETSDKGYSDFMNQTGAIRAAMFEDVSGKYVVTLHMAEGQKPTKEQIKVLEDIEKERGKPITVLVGNKDGMVNPEYTPTTLEQLKKDVGTTRSVDELATKTSEPVAKEFEKLDPRSMPSEEAMLNHATDIYERYGEADAIQFFDDYKKNLDERSIPIPNNEQQLDDGMHKMNTFATKDESEHVIGYEESTKAGVTEEDRAKAFMDKEEGKTIGGKLGEILQGIWDENLALVRKIRAMGGDVGEEFLTGQSRTRLWSEKEKPGWKETLKKFFSNDSPMGDKVADQADAAIERKVFQTDDGRVIELHRFPEDTLVPIKEKGKLTGTRSVKKGTEIVEWKNGNKRIIGHSDNVQLKRGDKFTGKDGKEATIVDGKVSNIESNSPYRYLHDAEASARIANMGLRKMARELEYVQNLKKSELFKRVGHSPDQPLKDLPRNWIVPSNIDRIPELRGWHFDPKTAAIISDFAKVWDDTMYMKLSNALVKNMMLNPIPHMFNEVMHLWNARGFSGWVDPRRLGMFADTARVAWRDVGNQTQFYRDIMREGGSILGASPRNKGYFDNIQKEASKQMFGTPEMKKNMAGLAKKLGTSVGDLYNGISESSQKAMWFTRDVMYVQLIREIMARQEKSGNKMTLKEAIDQAERHMPNYRLPSEVLGSRAVSQVLRDPRISMFSRYHYGMVKSLVNTIKDVNPNNLKTPEGRAHFREGVDSMLAIGVAMGVMYPLMDAMAEAVFGEGAEQRRAGPYHLLQAGLDFTTGKKDASALIWPVFTFNPVALTLGQLGLNKKIFTGKEIYHPDDDFMDKASDVTGYAVGQVPQAPPLMSATTEEGGATKLLARQLDIKAKTPEQLAREERAKARQERVKKGRDTKRDKGTYKP